MHWTGWLTFVIATGVLFGGIIYSIIMAIKR